MTETVEIFLERAEALLVTGDVTDALAELDQATRLAPDDPRPHFRRAELWIGLGDVQSLKKAWLALVRAITLGMDSAEVHFHLMRTLFELNELEGAQAAYEAAVRLDRGNARLREWGLRIAIRAGDLTRALKLVRKEKAAMPDDFHWMRWEAEILLRQGALSAARKAYTAVLRLHAPARPDPAAWDASRWGDLYLRRAEICRRQGDYPAALADLAQAGAFVPDDPGVSFGRGLVLWAQGDPDGALPYLGAALSAAGPDVRAGFRQELAGYPRLADLPLD